MEPLAYSIADAVKVSGIGRTRLYTLIGSGEIRAVKSGSKTLVLAASLRFYLAGLPPAEIGMAKAA